MIAGPDSPCPTCGNVDYKGFWCADCRRDSDIDYCRIVPVVRPHIAIDGFINAVKLLELDGNSV
jgi:hypothetical protein